MDDYIIEELEDMEDWNVETDGMPPENSSIYPQIVAESKSPQMGQIDSLTGWGFAAMVFIMLAVIASKKIRRQIWNIK